MVRREDWGRSIISEGRRWKVGAITLQMTLSSNYALHISVLRSTKLLSHGSDLFFTQFHLFLRFVVLALKLFHLGFEFFHFLLQARDYSREKGVTRVISATRPGYSEVHSEIAAATHSTSILSSNPRKSVLVLQSAAACYILHWPLPECDSLVASEEFASAIQLYAFQHSTPFPT